MSQLTPHDLTRFRQLQRVVAEAFKDRDSYLAQPPADGYVQRWLGSDRGTALVAMAEGEVVYGLGAREEVLHFDIAVA